MAGRRAPLCALTASTRERAILVGLETRRLPSRGSTPNEVPFDAAESLEELSALAESAGAAVIERILQSRPAPDAATLIGSDGLHPTEAGYRRIAEIFFTAIRQHLEE